MSTKKLDRKSLGVIKAPKSPGFRAIKQLFNRLVADPSKKSDEPISIDDKHVPSWQRKLVWSAEDMGMLVHSILNNYPIGMIVLWQKPDGVRVPIDGRQRLTAILEFRSGRVAIPDWGHVRENLRGRKFKLLPGDEAKGFKELELKERERFDDYEPSIVQYEDLAEEVAMDVFVKLQGGKSLTKAEIRAAMSGRLCAFVTDLTTDTTVADEDDDEVEDKLSRHVFFQEVNVKNVRKAHRGLCDVLLHEYLYPGKDKHWSSLESMYLEKATTLADKERRGFRKELDQFRSSVCVKIKGAAPRVMPQLRTTFLILTVFKVWRELKHTYAWPPGLSFAEGIQEFERSRAEHPKEKPWVQFTAALSNAGYAQGRTEERHQILMSFLLRKWPDLKQKDVQRDFTESQKIAIWDRAGGQCEFLDESTKQRCAEKFPDFRKADADHFLKHSEGGATSLANGRLLCQKHNRGRK